jgi:hypothetical protein
MSAGISRATIVFINVFNDCSKIFPLWIEFTIKECNGCGAQNAQNIHVVAPDLLFIAQFEVQSACEAFVHD